MTSNDILFHFYSRLRVGATAAGAWYTKRPTDKSYYYKLCTTFWHDQKLQKITKRADFEEVIATTYRLLWKDETAELINC